MEDILISLELLDAVGVKGEELRRRIASARSLALTAVLGVQNRVLSALAGQRIRGLPNLVPDLNRNPKFIAARVRGGYDEPLPALSRDNGPGREVLCISDEGVLIMAYRLYNPIACKEFVSYRWIVEDDIRVEDVQDYARAMSRVLSTHVAECERLSVRFDEVATIAQKLQAVASP
jgi:hypothetical protein